MPSTPKSILAVLATTPWLFAQTPPPLAPALRVEGDAIAAVDAAATSLDWEEAKVGDLRHLARLTALRRVQINPSGEDTAAWQTIGVDDLAVLAKLPALEQVTFPYCCHLTPAHLRKLAGCARLTHVNFINESFVLDADIGAALATWPALRSLQLSLIRVTPKGLQALQAAPRLAELELGDCRDLDEAGFTAITGLAGLCTLRLSGLGRPDILARLRGGDRTPSWAPDGAAMKRLAKLPALRELVLTQCTVPPRVLAELPQQLTALTLVSPDADAAVLLELRRHGALRRLTLADSYADDKEAARAATAGLLGALHLESFEWQGDLTPAMREAIAGQADLTELKIVAVEDLTFVTRLPKLTRLVLRRPAPTAVAGGDPKAWLPTAGIFAPLAQSKSLAEVVFGVAALEAPLVEELQRALGARIRLQLRADA